MTATLPISLSLRRTLPFAATLLLAAICLFWPVRARAAETPIACGDVAGLVAAIEAANAADSVDTITLAAGCTYTLTAAAGSHLFGGPVGLPIITQPLVIEGAGATIRRAAAAPSFRIFAVEESLTLRHLTLTGGKADSGGIAGSGGAILGVEGALIAEQSTFDGNQARTFGGAIAADILFSLNISGSTFSNNQAGTAATPGGGGAIFGGELHITNSTFSGNRTPFAGGAALEVGVNVLARIGHSTFTENEALGSGAAIVFGKGDTVITNTVVAGQASGANCAFSLALDARSNFNLSDDGTCGGSFTSVAPSAVRLAPLADNGGATLTHALISSSAAINAGDPAFAGEAFDQRGAGFARVRNGRIDIGAFEAAAATVGGTVTGLRGGGLVLALNQSYTQTIAAAGPFTFGQWLVPPAPYAVTVADQPQEPPQLCTVSNGSGTVTGPNVTNVAVTCVLDPSQAEVTIGVFPAASGRVEVLVLETVAIAGDFYPIGSRLRLTAIPNAGFAFAGWSGDLGGIENPVEITVTSSQTISAVFQPIRAWLPLVSRPK